MNLRPITEKDQIDLRKVYFDSIKTIKNSLYSEKQKISWSSQAWENPEFSKALLKGKGWIINQEHKTIGFGTRYPNNKLSLLYIRGDSKRKGFGSILLKRIEEEAKEQGISSLTTEASLISYKLLLKNSWKIIRKEKIIINDSYFERYKMIKNLISI